MNYHIDVAEDKSIGWTGYLFPGTRGNLQRDMDKKRAVINLTKFRLALRFSWAKSLHSLSPADLIKIGLRDPCMAFIKGEGHPPRKVDTKTWRLIWVVSELDRLLDASVFTEQDKSDIQSYQSGGRAVNGVVSSPPTDVMELAMGVGHDDYNLQRTFCELEGLLSASEDNMVRASDASGWDFSVSATSFWAGMETRLSRVQSDLQYRTYLIGGFFQCSWTVSSGSELWESARFGITASGSSITTSSNGAMRSSGSKLGQIAKQVGGVDNINKMSSEELKCQAQRRDLKRTAAGDDLLHSHDQDKDVIMSLGTLERGSESAAGTADSPVPFLSHHYFKEGSVWKAKYANGPKLFHRICHLLSQNFDEQSGQDQEKIIAAIAGQRFVLPFCVILKNLKTHICCW